MTDPDMCASLRAVWALEWEAAAVPDRRPPVTYYRAACLGGRGLVSVYARRDSPKWTSHLDVSDMARTRSGSDVSAADAVASLIDATRAYARDQQDEAAALLSALPKDHP